MPETLVDSPFLFKVILAVVCWFLLLSVSEWVLVKVDPNDRLHIRSAVLSPLGHGSFFVLEWVVDLVRRFGRRCRAAATWLHGMLHRCVDRYVRWSERRATDHLLWAQRSFGRDGDRLLPYSRAVVASMRAWYASWPAEVILYAVKTAVLVLAMFNVASILPILVKGTIKMWEGVAHPSKSSAPERQWSPPGPAGFGSETLDPVSSLAAGFHALLDKVGPYFSALADPVNRPMQACIAIVVIAFGGLALQPLRLFVRSAFRFVPGRSSERTIGPIYSAPVPRFELTRSLLSLKVGTNRRNLPVLVLVNCLAQVGAARQHYRTSVVSGHVTVVPRVHLAAVERVVWSAWRTRHPVVRGVQRAQYKEHSEKVVGVLRAVEARQDTDPDTGQVLEEMARLLAKVAERYAQGRVLALLDSQDLGGDDGPRAVNREWVRLVMLGVVVVGAGLGAPALGLSDTATTQFIGVISLIAVVLLYGVRLTPVDLLDVARGQSRK